MKNYNITTELFIEPYKNQFLFYSPLKQIAFLGNKKTKKFVESLIAQNLKSPLKESEINFLNYLKSLDIVNGKKDEIPKPDVSDTFQPTSAFLLPTANCNLKCIYCFSHGGDKKDKMNLDVAKSTIDFIIKNAKKLNKNPQIVFHGGGEPTLEWDLVIKSTEYFKSKAKENNLLPKTSMVTNGFLSFNKLDWIINNIDKLSISFDGLEKNQNYQRPTQNNKDTFQKIIKVFEYLKNQNYQFGIRATITKYNVKDMPKMVELFAKYNIHSASLEPLTEMGRSEETLCKRPNPDEYIKYFIKAHKIAKKNGFQINYSGLKLNKIGTIFCGTPGKNFHITPQGDVTSCHRISDSKNESSNDYYIGKFNKSTKKFDLNLSKIKELKKLNVLNIPLCQNCFCKWSCSGGCYEQNRSFCGKLILDKMSESCYITRELKKHFLVEQIKSMKGG